MHHFFQVTPLSPSPLPMSSFFFFFFFFFLFLLLRPSTAEVPQDGVRCLQGFKSSLSDPQGSLSTWSFPSSPPPSGFLCSFSGVSCWNEGENRLLTLNLPSSGLSGNIPSSLQYCSSLNHLQLPSNSLSGSIPSDLCSSWLPYLVSLDLSLNSLSGPIPSSLSSCRFLNDLLLNGNSLSGLIPPSLSSLSRLHRLSLADNSLSGAVPSSLSRFGPSAFSSNSHLCGDPGTGLPSCSSSPLSRSAVAVIASAAVLGALASLILAFALFRRRRRHRSRYSAASSSDWPDRLLPHKSSHVSLFHKPIVKIRVADLLAATNGFDDAQAISRPRTGAVYRGVLRDGSSLAVKRLPPPSRSAASAGLPEKQFRSEAAILGQLRHPNLVPLLGYCVVEDERLLIYKHLPGGTLRFALQQTPPLDWPARARIAVGAARGLAWLHHGIQPPLIHGGVSSGVILLDDDGEPRITEFGLSKLVAGGGGGGGGETSAFVDGELGEFGYVAPEYSATMIASLKGDVYAFGVVLLEILTGRKPTEIGEVVDGAGFKGNLVGWVNWLSGNGRVAEAVDASVLGKGYDEEVMGFVRVALDCVVSRPKDRLPMYKVYQMLKQLGEKHFGHEHYDEFPLLFGKDDAGAR